ncbi:MAG TPA: antibiotic biosynthesis monooxygenase [Candidatus Acidoferrales bacterium]|jgi:quinol monooxygenase YgiN|nr:antibiotic biosynthesis monooxygenase [Candidatus Acidoferrales bacterium]
MPMLSNAKIARRPLMLLCAALLLACGTFASLAVAQDAGGHDKIYVVTHVDIVPPNADAGTKLVKQYVADSRKDKGFVRIEAGAQISRVNHISIVEVWQNQKAFDEHVAAAHTREFRRQIDPMLGSPYDERLHLNLE